MADDDFDFLGARVTPPDPLLAGLDPVAAALALRVASADPQQAVAAVAEATRLRLATVQALVAERLACAPAAFGHAGVDAFVAYFDALGDGRCVRGLEAVLADHALALSEAHAWKLRHIVQRIRRFGRK
ncbi:MAG: hypothetical protein EXR79_08790 [Myxococcales bacterium]|nr:hypothetical protein [Myxococcales bacterium]